MITATTALTDEGKATLTIGDAAEDITADDLAALRATVLNRVSNHAQQAAAPVQLATHDPDGTRWVLVIHPDGKVEDRTAEAAKADSAKPEDDDAAAEADAAEATPEPEPEPAKRPRLREAARLRSRRRDKDSTTDAQPTTETIPPKPPQAPAEAQPVSFLTANIEEEPAREGWRGRLNNFGLRLTPDASEVAKRHAVAKVSQHWAGPRTVAMINGKGGAGKTPTDIYLAAAFARYGGGGVLAACCNLTRGTLGWSTEQANHENTMLELLPHADELLGTHAQSAALGTYVHHQTRDRYDVLRSNPLLLSTEQKLTPDDFDKIHAVAAKYYRMILLDSGNDEGDQLWLRVVEKSDQIVVPTNTREESAEAARLCLEALRARGGHYAELAANAVVVVSQADREEANAEEIAEQFRKIVPAVATIPYDRAIRRRWKRWDLLDEPTRDAYLQAAAAVAERL